MPAPKGNKYAAGNKGGGRPSGYKDEYADLAYKFCLLGATDEDLARNFEVSEQTINRWKGTYPEFVLALKSGKEDADAVIAKSLFHRAKGYEHSEDKIFLYEGEPVIVPTIKHYPPDPTSMIFWLKNRQPVKWRDKQEIDLAGKLTYSLLLPDDEDEGQE